MKRVLVVANETVAGKPLIDAVRKRADGDEVAGPRDLPPEPAEARLRDLRRARARRGRRTASR